MKLNLDSKTCAESMSVKEDAGSSTATQQYADLDLSFWTRNYIADKLRGLVHRGSSCKIVMEELMEHGSELYAVLRKSGVSVSLYYDFNLSIRWLGTCDGGEQMRGVIRLYNIGQETEFRVGGAPETSWMFEVGYPRAHFGESSGWVGELKREFESAVFETCCKVVTEGIDTLKLKATRWN